MALPRDRRREVGEVRQRVVHERAGEELGVGVVPGALHEHLSHALDHAAMELALDHHRVQHRAEVVHRAVAHDFDFSRLGVDLELADMAAVRERGWNYFGYVRNVQASRVLERHFKQGDRSVGASNHEPSIAKFDIGGRGFEHLGGELLAFLDDELGGLHCRAAAHHRRARATGAGAEHQLVGIALQQPDLLERHAELRREHLRHRRGVALAVVERAGDDGDVAVGFEAQPAHLLGRRRRDFEIVADADAAQLAAGLALGLAGGAAVDIGELQRLVQESAELAAVISGA